MVDGVGFVAPGIYVLILLVRNIAVVVPHDGHMMARLKNKALVNFALLINLRKSLYYSIY